MQIVKENKEKKLEFNTYFIFSKEEQDIKETVGLIFKDYIRKGASRLDIMI